MLDKELCNCAYCAGTGTMESFRCNICGEEQVKQLSTMERDTPSCYSCGSTIRVRSMIRALSTEIYGKNLILNEFPRRSDIFGLGMTDWDNYANILSRKLNYINTFYDKEPKLDITDTNPIFRNALDFLISSDVFEHVAPPVSVSFENAYSMLKTNGVFIFSVPYVKEGKTIEYFPDLDKYEIIQEGEKKILKNITKEGCTQIFENLVFHGCDALEMRTFSESSVIEELLNAGFQEIVIYDDPEFEQGIVFNDGLPLGVPMAARKATSSGKFNIIRKKDSSTLSAESIKSSGCTACGGKGRIFVTKPEQTCGRCDGTGSIQSGMCPACSGFGWMNVLKEA